MAWNNTKFMQALKFKSDDDYDDDDYYDEEEDDEEAVASPRKLFKDTDADEDKGIKKTIQKVTPMSRKKTNIGGMVVYGIKPTSMENAKEITDTMLENKTVVLNLEGNDVELARRILDFAMGTTYALNGTIQKISSSIYIIAPESVDISGAFQDIIG